MNVEIVTYASGNAPAGEEAIARIRAPMRTLKGKIVMDWHPVIITASTMLLAREKAQKWWDAQVEAERIRAENIQAGVAKRALARKAAEQVAS